MSGRSPLYTDYSAIPAPGSWIEEAACRGSNPAMFFAVGCVPNAIRQTCNSCPVRSDCLSYALKHNVQGVWGGTTDDERRRMRRRG